MAPGGISTRKAGDGGRWGVFLEIVILVALGVLVGIFLVCRKGCRPEDTADEEPPRTGT